MSAVKEAKTRGTKERILDAALKMFSKKGYLGAATKDIAIEAGVSEVTLFRYFPSKESLLVEVINTYTFLPTLKGMMSEVEAMSYSDALSEIARRFLETLHLRKDLVRIMHSEIQLYPEKARQIYHGFIDELFEIMASYFKKLQREGILRHFQAETAARAFLGMFFSLFTAQEFHLQKKLKKEDIDNTIADFVEIFVRGTLK